MTDREQSGEAVHRLQTPHAFRKRVSRALDANNSPDLIGDFNHPEGDGISVVLLLISNGRLPSTRAYEPCMILNKRSPQVRQPGDICCPGGGIEPRTDALLARLLRLPGSPLRRWACYSQWQQQRPEELRQLHLLLATALREGLEEMRLNPLGVSFLGRLPSVPLVMFHRVIHPLVVWVNRQRHFFPNWEVERVVRIPVRELLNSSHYICYRLTMPAHRAGDVAGGRLDFPAFRFATPHGTEILWGATFRIAMAFLKQVLDFSPPGLEALDVVERQLPPQYLTGTR